jgi:hypothetical protein
MAACIDHARVTDGLYPPGADGARRYRETLFVLLGEWPEPGTAGLAWRVAEAMRAHLEETRPGVPGPA